MKWNRRKRAEKMKVEVRYELDGREGRDKKERDM